MISCLLSMLHKLMFSYHRVGFVTVQLAKSRSQHQKKSMLTDSCLASVCRAYVWRLERITPCVLSQLDLAKHTVMHSEQWC